MYSSRPICLSCMKLQHGQPSRPDASAEDTGCIQLELVLPGALLSQAPKVLVQLVHQQLAGSVAQDGVHQLQWRWGRLGRLSPGRLLGVGTGGSDAAAACWGSCRLRGTAGTWAPG